TNATIAASVSAANTAAGRRRPPRHDRGAASPSRTCSIYVTSGSTLDRRGGALTGAPLPKPWECSRAVEPGTGRQAWATLPGSSDAISAAAAARISERTLSARAGDQASASGDVYPFTGIDT